MNCGIGAGEGGFKELSLIQILKGRSGLCVLACVHLTVEGYYFLEQLLLRSKRMVGGQRLVLRDKRRSNQTHPKPRVSRNAKQWKDLRCPRGDCAANPFSYCAANH